jgi:excisionase family DNA binding protein
MDKDVAKQLSDNLASRLTPALIKQMVHNIDWDAFVRSFNPTMSVQEVADFLGRPYPTVAAWVNKGLLKSVRNGQNGHPRILLSDLREFCTTSEE